MGNLIGDEAYSFESTDSPEPMRTSPVAPPPPDSGWNLECVELHHSLKCSGDEVRVIAELDDVVPGVTRDKVVCPG